MAIVFDSELKSRRLREIVMDFLKPMSSEFTPRCAALDASGSLGGAKLLFERLITDVVNRIPLAQHYKDNSEREGFKYCRVFNGQYYERVPLLLVSETIYSGWLFDHCKMNLKFYGKFKELCRYSIINALVYRVLQPSLRVMCFKNGVVNFDNLELKPFSSEYHCVKQYDFNWNPKADCPTWKKFLGMPAYKNQSIDEIEGVLPEYPKRVVLQKFLGGGFIDRKKVKFEYLMILYGTGANGKSVIKDVLDGIFGKDEVFPNLQFSALTKEGFDGFNARRVIDGYRFAYCTEMSPSEFKRPDMVKAVASGESVSGRGIGENTKAVTDIPIFICNSNYDWGEVSLIPKDSPDDESMARRVLLLNFDRKIPEGRRDPELSEKLLKEKEGIFQWMVSGYRRLKRDKWKIHDTIFGRIEHVRQSANRDKIPMNGKFVHGSVVEYASFKGISPIMDDEHKHAVLISTTDIYENYVKFCKNNGLACVQSPHKLSLDFGTMGYRKRIGFGSNNCNGYVMYWNRPVEGNAFRWDIPSIEKILNLDAILGTDEETDEFDEQL